MGRDKAWLPFGDETLLQRVVRIAAAATAPQRVVVVAGRDQRLPELPAAVEIIRDRVAGAGPLPALAAGLSQVACVADLTLVTACDAPLISPTAIGWLFDQLAAAPDHVLGVSPFVGNRWQPLIAAYRAAASARLYDLVDSGVESLQTALEQLPAARISESTLCVIDPALNLLVNCNSPAEYDAARAAAGLP